MLLNNKERERFIAYLDQQVYNCLEIAKQMKSISIPETLIKRESAKAAAYEIVANDLRNVESGNANSDT